MIPRCLKLIAGGIRAWNAFTAVQFENAVSYTLREETLCAAQEVNRGGHIAERKVWRGGGRDVQSTSFTCRSLCRSLRVPHTWSQALAIKHAWLEIMSAQRKAIFIVLHSPVRAWMYRQKKAKYGRASSARAGAYGTFFSSILASHKGYITMCVLRAAIVQCLKMQIRSFCWEIKGSLYTMQSQASTLHKRVFIGTG